MNIDQHIKIVAIINIALGSLLAFVGLVAFMFFAGFGIVAGDPKAIPILGLLGSVGFVFMLGFGLPGILGGIGLLKRQEWGRILVIWVEIYDERSGEWIPADPSVGIIGLEPWLKSRVGFGERWAIDTSITNDMIVPIAIFAAAGTN